MCEGIRDERYAAVFIAPRVIDGLDATSARSVILRGCHLQLTVERKRPDALDKAFAESPLAHDGRPVIILKRACDYFGRRGGRPVYQHHHRSLRVNRVQGGLEADFLPAAAFLGYNRGSLRNKHRNYAHSLLQQASAIAPEVQDQKFHTLVLESCNCLAHSLGHILRKTGLEYVACRVIYHTCIFNVRQVYPFPGHPDVHDLAAPHLPDLRSRLAFHPVAALLRLQTCRALTVYLEYAVPAHQSRAACRRARIRLIDINRTILLRLVYDCADTAVGLSDHHLEILVLLLGHIYRVRVQAFEHRVYGGALHPAYREGIDI